MGASAVMLGLALACAATCAATGVATPSGPQVPANLLRIELQFDRPMPGLARDAVALRDGAGHKIDGALLDIILPDRDERRFVVLMQPGRIKHGVGPNLALGPALHEGDVLTLEVRDRRLAQPLLRQWQVGAPSEQAIMPSSWTIHPPLAGTRMPLRLTLPFPVNASGAGLIAVADRHGRQVPGHARFEPGETVWRFVPSVPWSAGVHQLRIHPGLEDPAGNRMCAPFEARRQSEQHCDDEQRLAFAIAPLPVAPHAQ